MNGTLGEKKQPRLWVVSEVYYPEETSTGYYLTRIAEGLSEDLCVKVICGQPNYSMRGVKAPRREMHAGVDIYRVFGTTLDKNVIVFRLVNMITFSIAVFAAAIRRFNKGDRVLAVTNPPTMPFIIALASLFRGASYTLLIHDTYPEIIVAAGKTRPDSLLRRFADVANRWLYKYASKIIVVGRDMKELAERKTAGLDIPVQVIPNWAELESVRPGPRDDNPLLRELGLSEKLVFLYAGNMGYPNDVESIVTCAEELRYNSDIHFVFLGAGAKKKWLAKEVVSRDLKNVSLLEPRPRTEQQVFLNACDVALVSLVRGMRGVSVPSRTYNILAAGKPVLALVEDGSEVANVIEEEGIGWVVPPGSPAELAQVVLEIQKKRHLLIEMGQRARQAAVAKYSVNTAIREYRDSIL